LGIVRSIDIETAYGPNRFYDKGFYLTCIGITDNFGKKEVFWFDHKDNHEPWDESLKRVRYLIETADTIVAHNLKYDMTVLRGYGISFENQELWCTMVTEYLLSGQDTRNRSFSLDACATHRGLGTKIDKVKELWSMGVQTYDINQELLHEYVLHDCDLAMGLYEVQSKDPEYQYIKKVHKLQMEFQLSLSDIELYGFKLDVHKAKGYVEQFDNEIKNTTDRMKEIVGDPHINIGSDSQRSAILFGGALKTEWREWHIQTLKTKRESKYYKKRYTDEYRYEGLGFTPIGKKNKKGNFPVDKNTLEDLRARTPIQKEVKSLLLEYSVVKKARETLLGKDDKGLINKIGTDGHVHSNMNMAVTATGRLSSSDPNNQNIPRGSTSPLKKCIIPYYDGILQADLSQKEWRGAAESSQDEVMIHEINSGIDQHNAACVDLMELELNKANRTHAKIFNFRMIYGGSAYGYYRDGKMPNFPLYKWDKIVADFCEKYSGLTEWQERNIESVYKNNGTLRIMTGRKFVFERDKDYAYKERAIKNYPVQGLAGGDILPLLVVVIRRGLKANGFKSRMILSVHDSIVFDYLKEEYERLVNLVSQVFKDLTSYIKAYYGIPWRTNLAGELEAGPNYGALEKIK